MKADILKEKEVNFMIFLFMITYMVSYITRINYASVIAAMEEETKLAKTMLSMALTGSFVTYGAGQIVSGVCSDKFSAKKLVFCGLIVTSAMNLLIPFLKTPLQMTAVWCVNGFAQAFMWPPMVKLMSGLFSDKDYKRASVIVSWGAQLGTVLVYLVSPVLIVVSGWRLVFIVSAVSGIVMAVLWNRFCIDVSVREVHEDAEEKSMQFKGHLFLLSSSMIAILLHGIIRDGITTWMPSYISDEYNLGSAVSILTGVAVPLFSILCLSICSRLYIKVLKNPFVCAGVFFGACATALAFLSAYTGKNAPASVLFSALASGCINGVNMMFICMLPQYFRRMGKTGTVSGIFNACTYIGSAVSAYGVAAVSSGFGWGTAIKLWLAAAIVGGAICTLCIIPSRRIKRQ